MHYKFLDTVDVDKVLIDGTIIISSLEYFRRLEEKEWAEIGDPLDDASELTTSGEFIVTEGSRELEMINNAVEGLGLFKGKFANVSGGGMIDMSGVRFVTTVPPLFIYSVAGGNIEDLTKIMCVDAKRPYNACLRVADLQQLQRHIFACGRVRNLNCAVTDIFLPGLIEPVAYEPRSRDVREGLPTLEPSPFKKAERFRRQSEVRMLFVPKEGVPIAQERLIIEIPETSTYFTEVFRNYTSNDTRAVGPTPVASQP
jgi:hypothetical protein